MKTSNLVVGLASLLCALPSVVSAEERAVMVDSARDAVSRWTPNQHLYVKGNIGLSPARLAKLEEWLDENGPHWTIVLMNNSNGETYQAADGRTFFGMDAVEYAFGHGLSNRTSFGELTDERTGESDGAVFVMFLIERKFSYFGSDAQDRRGLGESHWIGELDRPAFRAMRGGQRIADAVMDTVTTINSRLQKTIAAEAEAAAQELRRRKNSVAELQTRLSVIGEETDQVETFSKSHVSAYPDAKGGLTEPPVEEWRGELQRITVAVTDENVYSIGKEATSLGDRVAEYLNAFIAGNQLAQQITTLNERIDGLNNSPNSVAVPDVERARVHLENSKKEWADGRFEFRKQLSKATRAVNDGYAAVAAEEERIAKAKARRALIQKTAAATGLIALCGLGGLGYTMNRRRAPVKDEAKRVLAERKKSVDAEVEKVFDLFERSYEILGGSRERLKERGYEGSTKKLGEKTFDNVDDLIVMSSEVERVMDEAEELIEPQSTIGRAVNIFSGSRYKQGIEKVSGKPLEFKRDKGLPLVLEDEEGNTNETLDEDGQPVESIQLTFEDVFARFHDRTNRAAQTLDKIEHSFLELNNGLTELQSEIDSATELEQEVTVLSDENEYFAAPSFFDVLLPSAQADSDTADSIAVNDPVRAVGELIPTGKRKIRESRQLAATLKRGHQELLPQLRKLAPQLEEEGYETEWIDQRLSELTDRGDQLFAEAAEHSVLSSVDQFDASVSALGERTERCLEIARLLKNELIPSVERLDATIKSGRSELAEHLNLSYDDMLREHPHDPDVNLKSAQLQVEGIRAALHHGNVEAASEAMGVLQRDVETGEQIVSDSLKSLHGFDEMHGQRSQEVDASRGRFGGYEGKVDEARRTYSDTTLRFQTADESFSDADADLDSHLTGCREGLDEAGRLLHLSREYFYKGKVLEASAMLDAIAEDVAEVEQRYQEVDDHLARIRERERENQSNLESMVARIDGLKSRVADHRTTEPTMNQFRESVEQVQGVAREVESQTADRAPFETAARVEELTLQLDDIEALIEADRKAHAEADRAVESARSQSAVARRLKQRARQDGIPDSRATTSLVGSISRLGEDLEITRRKLDEKHLDWKGVHEDAITIHRKLDEASGQLRGELQIAEQAAASVESASREVFQAARWTGGWGVRIFGSPGSRQIERARDALQRADYQGAINLSRAASMAASQAIIQAQREVARRERERQRRAEQARRRRRSINIGSGSSRGGGGGGISMPRPSRRISSGSRRSGSSTSGFKRSGW